MYNTWGGKLLYINGYFEYETILVEIWENLGMCGATLFL